MEPKQECPYKVGDVVRLRSGGPRLTVVEVRRYEPLNEHEEFHYRLSVSWFRQDSSLDANILRAEAVESERVATPYASFARPKAIPPSFR
jgi:uncharacterized protein YodC (DUF2158 family)